MRENQIRNNEIEMITFNAVKTQKVETLDIELNYQFYIFMEVRKMNESKIIEILEFEHIKNYLVNSLEVMAGSFIVTFPIGAQIIQVNELENMQKNFLEYFTSANLSINGSNLILILV